LAAPGGVFIFLLAFVFSKKNLDNSDFSWRRHFLMLSTPPPPITRRIGI
jgi:hypothetical protein